MRIFILLLSLAAAPLLLPAAGYAQHPNEAAARAAFAEGERQFDAGNHQLALDAFQQMHDLMEGDARAQAMVSYNIALCHDRLGRLAEALTNYERFLAETPPDAPYRERASDRVRELRGRAAAQARESEDPVPATPTEPAPSGDSVLGPIGIALASVGGAALLAAIPTGVLALDGEAHLTESCPGGACPASEQGRIDETRTLGIVTDVLWVSGAIVAAAGLSLVLVDLLGDGDEAHATGRVTPSIGCTDRGCIASMRGQF